MKGGLRPTGDNHRIPPTQLSHRLSMADIAAMRVMSVSPDQYHQFPQVQNTESYVSGLLERQRSNYEQACFMQNHQLQNCVDNMESMRMLEDSLQQSIANLEESTAKLEAELEASVAEAEEHLVQTQQACEDSLQKLISKINQWLTCDPNSKTWPICRWKKDPTGIPGSSEYLFKQMQTHHLSSQQFSNLDYTHRHIAPDLD